jgi:hypothetical protein
MLRQGGKPERTGIADDPQKTIYGVKAFEMRLRCMVAVLEAAELLESDLG